MSLVDVLKGNREKAIDERAIEFAENMENIILESSENGYSGYKYQIHSDNPDKHILCSPLFTGKLEDLMDGVKVTFEKVEKKNPFFATHYYENYIHFSWAD